VNNNGTVVGVTVKLMSIQPKEARNEIQISKGE
jgi:hypothetical protein